MPRLLDVTSIFRRRSATAPRAEATVEMKPERPVLSVRPARQHARQQQEEVMGLVRKIGEHLDRQTVRTERLVTLMERLPQALDALPEINRQNARLLDALHEHFEGARQRDTALNATLGRITEASGRQTEVLRLVQQQLGVTDEQGRQLTETLASMRGALGELAESNKRSINVMSHLAESTARRETDLAVLFGRAQRGMLVALAFCGTASVAALVVALLALAGG